MPLLNENFFNKPTVYLETDSTRTEYILYVNIQVPEDMEAKVACSFEGETLVAVVYTMEPRPEHSPASLHQQTFSFTAPADKSSEFPHVVVAVAGIDGKTSTVIVHHADADLPGIDGGDH